MGRLGPFLTEIASFVSKLNVIILAHFYSKDVASSNLKNSPPPIGRTRDIGAVNSSVMNACGNLARG